MPDDAWNAEADAARPRLVELIDYVHHMVALGQKAVLRLDQFGGLVVPEQSLRGRVGIQHDLQDEDGAVWLSIDRLKRIGPPAVPDEIAEWISVPNDPTRKTAIEPLLVTTIPIEQAEEEVRQGILGPEDVQVPPEDGAADPAKMRDVIYRLERLPMIGNVIRAYIEGPRQRWVTEERPPGNHWYLRPAVQPSPDSGA